MGILSLCRRWDHLEERFWSGVRQHATSLAIWQYSWHRIPPLFVSQGRKLQLNLTVQLFYVSWYDISNDILFF